MLVIRLWVMGIVGVLFLSLYEKYKYTHTHTHIYTYTHTHIHTHTHTHTHTHIYERETEREKRNIFTKVICQILVDLKVVGYTNRLVQIQSTLPFTG